MIFSVRVIETSIKLHHMIKNSFLLANLRKILIFHTNGKFYN